MSDTDRDKLSKNQDLVKAVSEVIKQRNALAEAARTLLQRGHTADSYQRAVAELTAALALCPPE